MDVGASHGLEVKHVVGCIANEAGLPSEQIGKIRIHGDYTTVELPSDLSADLIAHIGRAWVCGRQLNMTTIGQRNEPRGRRRGGPSSPRSEDSPDAKGKPSRSKGGERDALSRPPSKKKKSPKGKKPKKPANKGGQKRFSGPKPKRPKKK